MTAPSQPKIKPKRKAPPGAFKPGHAKVGGRRPGSPNKFTKTMREAVLKAFNELGGSDYLVKMGKSNLPMDRRILIPLFGRMLPLEITGENGAPVSVQVVNEAKDV